VPKAGYFSGLACSGAFLAGVGFMLVTSSVEIDAPIVVLLTVSRVGASVMKLNGKSRMKKQIPIYVPSETA
jgi:hypothetical protein